jgi:hypothetical protein
MVMTLDSSRFDLHPGSLQNYGELLAEIETLNIPRPEFHIASLWRGLQPAEDRGHPKRD